MLLFSLSESDGSRNRKGLPWPAKSWDIFLQYNWTLLHLVFAQNANVSRKPEESHQENSEPKTCVSVQERHTAHEKVLFISCYVSPALRVANNIFRIGPCQGSSFVLSYFSKTFKRFLCFIQSIHFALLHLHFVCLVIVLGYFQRDFCLFLFCFNSSDFVHPL